MRRGHLLLLLASLLVALVGCSGDGDDATTETTRVPAPPVSAPEEDIAEGDPRPDEDERCELLQEAVGADTETGREEAVEELRSGIGAETDTDVLDALDTLESELVEPAPEPEFRQAVSTLEEYLECDGVLDEPAG